MFGYEEELQDEIAELKAENEKLKLRLSVVIKSLPTTEDIEHFASNKRKQDWSVELGNGASEYERGLIFGAKWMKQQIEGNVL
jgi:hypothetical protein